MAMTVMALVVTAGSAIAANHSVGLPDARIGLTLVNAVVILSALAPVFVSRGQKPNAQLTS